MKELANVQLEIFHPAITYTSPACSVQVVVARSEDDGVSQPEHPGNGTGTGTYKMISRAQYFPLLGELHSLTLKEKHLGER